MKMYLRNHLCQSQPQDFFMCFHCNCLLWISAGLQAAGFNGEWNGVFIWGSKAVTCFEVGERSPLYVEIDLLLKKINNHIYIDGMEILLSEVIQWLQILGCLFSDTLWCETIARSSVTATDDACQEETRQEISPPQKTLRLENTGISAKGEFKSASQHEVCSLCLDCAWLAGEWAGCSLYSWTLVPGQ